MDWLERLSELRKKKRRVVAGLMSGTSVDGVDVAICGIEGAGVPGRDGKGARVELIAFYSHSYDQKLQRRVRECKSAGVREVAELNSAIAELFSQTLHAASAHCKIAIENIDLLGSHGQTVYHHSRVPGAIKTTLQLGDGDIIAERTGLPVFFDFRARDVAAGGEGAPLAPYGDLVLFLPHLASGTEAAVLNLGGIGNLTILCADTNRMLGFDTGPANAPLDRITRILTNGAQQHDVDGTIARSGKIQDKLLQDLLSIDSFLKAKPPKSTGFEMYGDEWVAELIKKGGGASANLLATATEFVARSVALALKEFVAPQHKISKVIVAGGGAKNPFLMERLAQAVAPIVVTTSDSLGVPGHAREAMAFAVLANDALCGIPTSLPAVTGCGKRVIQGKLALPA